MSKDTSNDRKMLLPAKPTITVTKPKGAQPPPKKVYPAKPKKG